MAPESQEQQNGSTEDISGEQQDEQQAPTSDTEGNGEQQAPAQVTKDTKLPDDHPVVKQLAADKAKLAKANAELAELRAKSTQVTSLEEQLNSRPTQEALDTLQTRYDRLEEFAQAVGLGKALDSRTFTRDLFETEKDIKDLVKEWQRANPTATSQALGGTAGGEGSKKHDPNELLRIAAGKA